MSDSGERELVLGNKQLLAIFFVAALLCGVFFALGYVVGGNSVKAGIATAATDAASTAGSDGKREEPPASSAGDNSGAGNSPSASPTDAASQSPAPESRVADNPAAAGAQPPADVPPPAQAVQSAPPPPAATGIVVSVPEKGTSYWQVAAPTRPAADDLVKSLREKGLPAILAASSKPELFEVLVGPYRSSLTLSDAKRKLIDLGFNGIVPRKQ